MAGAAIATDAQGRDVVVVHHRVERGVDERAGQFAVVRVSRTLRQNGDVAAVSRWVVSWHANRVAADNERCRLDGYSQVS